MPKIRSAKLEDHNEAVWAALTDAIEHLLATHSYEEITFATIGQAAGLARNTLYNYARDKPTLIAKAAAHAAQQLLEEVTGLAQQDKDPPERLADIFRAILTWFSSAQHRHLVLRSMIEPAGVRADIASAPLAEINAPVGRVVQEGIAAGQFQPVRHLRFTVAMMAGVVHAAAISVVRAPQELEAILNDVVRFSLLGLGHQGTFPAAAG